PIKETLRTKDIVASSAAALVSDRAYRPPSSQTSTVNFKKNDSFLTKSGNAGFLPRKNFPARPNGLWRHILALTSSQSIDLSVINGASRGGAWGYADAHIQRGVRSPPLSSRSI
ncbi:MULTISPECIES: hypothetical protein, partial [unclassified Ensifer]|uniref:hypothetical protein n=1 Tax=unclassified Ensifer TaxID=2633371 RepID=UPI001AECD686